MDVKAIRKDFPILARTMQGKPLVYLDTAATAQKPRCVVDAMSNFLLNEYGTVHRAVYQLAMEATAKYQGVREQVARFIGAGSADEVVFTRGTTESINLVAHCAGLAWLREGDEIVLSQMEHHANIVPWQMVCEQRGAKLRVIPVTKDGELDIDAYAGLLNNRTRIVSVTHMSNTLGTINPIKRMAEMAHAVDAKIFVDGAQSVPDMPVDVQALDIDFFAFSGHKAYGPTGVGVLWGRKALLDQLPPYQGGGSMIDRVTFERTTYESVPARFEAGTPMVAEVIGLGRALEYLSAIGMEEVHAYKAGVFEGLLAGLRSMKRVRLMGNPKERGAIVSFNVEGAHPYDIGSLLDLRGIAVRTGHHCTQPLMDACGVQGTVRVSLGIYNTAEEVTSFCEALEAVLAIV